MWRWSIARITRAVGVAAPVRVSGCTGWDMPDGGRLPVLGPVWAHEECVNKTGERPCPHHGCRFSLPPVVQRRGERKIPQSEIDEILRMDAAGVAHAKIARTVKRSHSVVVHVVHTLGGKGATKQHSCTLDAADDGPMTYEQIGLELGVSPQRAKQIYDAAMKKIQATLLESPLLDYAESVAFEPLGRGALNKNGCSWTSPRIGADFGLPTKGEE